MTVQTSLANVSYSILEEACPHITWGVPRTGHNAPSLTWIRNTSATLQPRYTSIPCTVAPDDCEDLHTVYASQLESWRIKYDYEPMNDDMRRERAKIISPSCVRGRTPCTDACYIYASTAHLYYFRPRGHLDRDMCNPEATPLLKPFTADDSKLFRKEEHIYLESCR